jgi:hypothetical protein
MWSWNLIILQIYTILKISYDNSCAPIDIAMEILKLFTSIWGLEFT